MKAAVLNIESEAFGKMKQDMNATIQATIKTMLEKGCDTATIATKITIDLRDEHTPDQHIHTHYAKREIIVPRIEHKVTSSLQIKSEVKGNIGGKGFELVNEGGKYILKPIGPEQVSLFDSHATEDEVDEDTDEDYDGKFERER